MALSPGVKPATDSLLVNLALRCRAISRAGVRLEGKAIYLMRRDEMIDETRSLLCVPLCDITVTLYLKGVNYHVLSLFYI